MTGDAPVAHQADVYDFPHLPPGAENDAVGGSPVLASLPNGNVSPYRWALRSGPWRGPR
jgi:hypothetical protein